MLSIFSLTSCKAQAPKPDAYLCTFIQASPIDNSYSFCVNVRNSSEKKIPVNQMKKFVTMSPSDYELIRAYYKEQCK